MLGSSFLPNKTYPPLIVYPDRILPGSLATKRFQAIARRISQIRKVARTVDHAQLAESGDLHIMR